ncbi:MAG: glycosyltransferase family 2 protein [Acidobacteria bacterium]|nr:glycosyltransferase family 2 protein [Acidobacteriota bacterium]MCI0627759.1 glycosyltransferase family 2 protein [Acidobacteriota bacterium]MCI0723537.1 glycosyltransferase family 2 protein [Acidobacteriota bacterium]
MNPPKLTVVIPVYNERNSLQEIIQRVQSVPIEKEIILVDDFSSDGTRDLLRDLEKQKFKVLYHEKNMGKGAALRTGFQQATGEFVIVQDADLEYDPNDYPKLLQPILDGKADVVYGSRFSGGRSNMTSLHTLGNLFLTGMTNLLYRASITDMETCYKLFKRATIQGVRIDSNRFNFEPEITAKILKRGLRIVEVPISYSGRSFSEGKKITWRDGFSAVWTLIKYRFVE